MIRSLHNLATELLRAIEAETGGTYNLTSGWATRLRSRFIPLVAEYTEEEVKMENQKYESDGIRDDRCMQVNRTEEEPPAPSEPVNAIPGLQMPDPCPWCETTTGLMIAAGGSETSCTRLQVRCICGASGPWAASPAAAIKSWEYTVGG